MSRNNPRITTRKTFEAWLTDEEWKILNDAAKVLGSWSIEHLVKFATVEWSKQVLSTEIPPEQRKNVL